MVYRRLTALLLVTLLSLSLVSPVPAYATTCGAALAFRTEALMPGLMIAFRAFASASEQHRIVRTTAAQQPVPKRVRASRELGALSMAWFQLPVSMVIGGVALIAAMVFDSGGPKDDSVKSRSKTNHVRWEKAQVDATALTSPHTEQRLVPLTHYRYWGELSEKEIVLIKTLTLHAIERLRSVPEGPQVISAAILEQLLDRDDGLWELVRRVHPYSVAAAEKSQDFSLHFRSHEAVYYALFIEKVLGRLPANGIAVVNLDPHSDAQMVSVAGTNLDLATGVLTIPFINDQLWAAAAVRDGLAPWVLSEWQGTAALIEKNVSGDVALAMLLEQDLFHFTRPGNVWVTVDFDAFSYSNGEIDLPARMPSFHLNDEVVSMSLWIWISSLARRQFSPTRLITAESPAYLHPVADKAYVDRLWVMIRDRFESLFNNGHSGVAQARASFSSRQALSAA